jgi:redox-sensitive bicupin YhaK (pirin superfamily)
VALPAQFEDSEPDFAHYGNADLPEYEFGGLWGRLVAGEAYGAKAKVKTFSPMFYLHWRLKRGTKAGMPGNYSERAAYIVSGSVEVDARTFGAGQMLVFKGGSEAVIHALEDSVVMALGGEPIGERFIEWNFVSSSKEKIQAAKADWRAGRMRLPQLDHDEFIPLPD